MDAKRIKQRRTPLEMAPPVLRARRHHLQTAQQHAGGDDLGVADLQQRAEQADGLLVQLEAVEGGVVADALLALHLAGRDGEDDARRKGRGSRVPARAVGC